MQIESISLAVPTREITNELLLDSFEQANSDCLPADQLQLLRSKLELLLDRCGSQTRYYRDHAKGEDALSLIQQAVRNAFLRSQTDPSEIDLLIYCGISRGVLEPATAYLIARSLGMQCQAFDVLDACMGWVRALHIANSFFGAGTYRRILVVTAEFNIYEHGYPELLRFQSPEQLDWTFPAFTIGEAAAATILAQSSNTWNFYFECDPGKAALCALPIRGVEDYDPCGELARNGIHRFMSHGRELTAWGIRRMSAALQHRYADLNIFDVVFPHAANFRACRAVAKHAGILPRVYTDVVRTIGNVASVSIPAAMVMAERDGRLRRGDRFLLCPVSAGMALALADAVY